MASFAKYHNKNTRGYDSAKEAERARVLRLMEKAGKIRELEEQVSFTLLPAQYDGGKCVERPVRYVADFVYVDAMSGKKVVEDVKGVKTPEYVIKRKLMLHILGIRINEV